jgi:crotonobetainyl-CoA:carnitine CoA-transferase CaiB-like acyl-CoA transferase
LYISPSHLYAPAMTDARTALANLTASLGFDGHAADRVTFTGEEQQDISCHRISTASAVSFAAQGTAIAELWRLRTGTDQSVSVDLGRATQGLNPHAHTIRDGVGRNQVTHAMPWCYPTADGRYVLLVLGSARPHQMERTLETAGVSAPADLGPALARWDAQAFEEAIYAKGAVGAVVRSPEEWLAHPQGQYLASRPLIEIERISDGAPLPFPEGARPLDGFRILDATHIIAGPMSTRTLAEQGGDVLHITRPQNYDTENFAIDFGVGKRNAILDLDAEAGRATLADLAAGADVFVQSYRPGSMAARGFSPEALAARSPGMVIVSVSCFGYGGPLGYWRGVDPIAQAVTGICALERDADGVPQLNRAATLTDPLVGYLAAAGAVTALIRRAKEGGSYHVRVALARCGMWNLDLGPSGGHYVDGLPLTFPQFGEAPMVTMASRFGELQYMAPVTQYSATPASWARPAEPAGTSDPVWLPRS